MKRLITLSTNIAKTPMPGADMVDIENLDNVINCSIDTIFAYVLEFIPENSFDTIFKKILSKLRPQGEIYIKFVNFKNVCNMYYKNELTDTDLINFLRLKTNILSIDTISNLLDSKYAIAKIDHIDNFIVLGIQRIAL